MQRRTRPTGTWPRAVLAALLAAGCVTVASPSGPGSSSLASPAPAPSTVVADEAAARIRALVDEMAAAVSAGDRDGYLALVDLSDPVFATEHVRWADEWAGPHPATLYELSIDEPVVSGDVATTDLTVTWIAEGDPSGGVARTATFTAQFARLPGGWRYAGEAWTSTELPHFVVRVAPGLEDETAEIAGALPPIYDHVTAALEYEPANTMEIKVYADGQALVANTLLSLPEIAGWNEPGEALKLVHRPDGSAPGTIAHELTHFLGFDRAGTKRTRMPWWLEEGIAVYVASELAGGGDGPLGQVIEWAALDALAPWADMEVFEDTPLELWTYVYPQGYAMARFVTERFGEDRRNAWLAAMATDMDIDAATPAELNLTFAQLDAAFRSWLLDQR